MKRTTKLLALCAMISMTAVGQASAQSYTFNTTGAMADNGTYGNSLPFSATAGSSTLKLQVTGWQSNQANNAITAAYVGAYSPGIGVTGIGDSSGANNYHQIDNAGGYTDFVLLQFSAPVVITSVNLNSFLLGSATTTDNDLAIYAASIPEAAWNSPINLASYTTTPASWTTVAGSGANGSVATGMHLASQEWLIGAAFNSGGNDGFKIASLTVNSAVPEPDTWAMMIVGFGMVGYGLRRVARRSEAKFDAKIKRITEGAVA